MILVQLSGSLRQPLHGGSTASRFRTATPDRNPCLGFFLQALQSPKRRLEKKMDRERVILAKLSVLILELVREHGRVTVAEAARASGSSRNTVKDHVKALVELGHLNLHGAGRGA